MVPTRPASRSSTARIGGALVRRLAALFEAERGFAPAPWAWLALGSEARREQPLPSDQDHALAFAPASGAEAWARNLAERLGEDLEAAGFRPCPGGLSALRWHATLDTWCGSVNAWMGEPESALGPLGCRPGRRAPDRGTPRREPSPDGAGAGSRAPALPPRAGAGRARVPAAAPRPAPHRGHAPGPGAPGRRAPGPACCGSTRLAARSPAGGTRARLEAAWAAGLLGDDAAGAAAAAFRVLANLRFHAELPAGGQAGRVQVAGLAPGERRAVLDALAAVRRLQQRAAHRFGLG